MAGSTHHLVVCHFAQRSTQKQRCTQKKGETKENKNDHLPILLSLVTRDFKLRTFATIIIFEIFQHSARRRRQRVGAFMSNALLNSLASGVIKMFLQTNLN